MAFQAEIGIVNNSGVGTILDSSNYGDDISTGIFYIDRFSDFKMIVVDLPDGNTYTFSSLYPTDGSNHIQITPDDDTTFETQYIFQPIAGTYHFTLYVCPTWSKDCVPYEANYCVYHLGNLYKSKAGTNNEPPTVTANWDLLGDPSEMDGAFMDTITYELTEGFPIITDLIQCRADLLVKANCTDNTNGCSELELCKNPNWIKANILSLVILAIEKYLFLQKYQKAYNLYNNSLTFCDCLK